ncbi:primosomal protein DnaI [Caldibacillus lycopersici]|uniref:Primosomal protein DnaI n=1 Tax=Perspicuibacillus lycopersici TaxID=1325689 RepID=A0AAE3LR38_9BACI|nr:primosomal protein DnaI [Perspicuibacillus lycopersici]
MVEKIGDTLKKLGERSSFLDRYEKMRKEILDNPEVRRFIEENRGEVTRTMIDNSLVKLYEFISQSKNCANCTCLGECKNIIPGFEPELVINRNVIDVHYVPCKFKVMEDEKKKAERLIQCLHMPKEILQASMSDVLIDSPSRLKAVQRAEQFIEKYNKDNFQRGFYFYGPFGTGKTYLLGAIANELARRKIPSLIVYVPELIREMKQSINDHTLNDKLQMLKNAPILMFDDIGAEAVSSWVRDEVLSPILQYRMLEKLPTFFTSNFDLQALLHHLTYSQRGEEEKLKAGRIIERIQYLADPIKIDGKNKRFESEEQ